MWTIVYLLLIVALFALDRDRTERTSPALWLSIVWLSICASRPVSMWFGGDAFSSSTDQYLEGSPFDRACFLVLLVLAVAALVPRGRKVASILRANWFIVIFLVYGGISIVWSDFPDVAIKRWIKAVGSLAIVLIVLTEAHPLIAVRRLLTRVGFLLVPISVVLIKYYPDLGRGYNRFTWTPYYRGVSTGKNELGFVCMICGIGAVWRLLQMLGVTRAGRKTGPLVAQIVLLAMVFWLFAIADSMTSLSCFIMATTLMVATSYRQFVRKSWAIHALVVVMLGVTLSALFLGAGSGLVETMGRDQTLTGRTEVWNSVLALVENPLIGTGFESFWLGSRLDKLWVIHWWHPNEAHSGYIEVYSTLGWIGLVLFAAILTTGYRKVTAALRCAPEEGRLRVALVYTALAYNCTESAVGAMHPVWILLTMAAMTVPRGWMNHETTVAVPQ